MHTDLTVLEIKRPLVALLTGFKPQNETLISIKLCRQMPTLIIIAFGYQWRLARYFGASGLWLLPMTLPVRLFSSVYRERPSRV